MKSKMPSKPTNVNSLGVNVQKTSMKKEEAPKIMSNANQQMFSNLQPPQMQMQMPQVQSNSVQQISTPINTQQPKNIRGGVYGARRLPQPP